MTTGKAAYPCVAYLFPSWVLNSQVSEETELPSWPSLLLMNFVPIS